jgi:hypothetical protein
MEARIPSGAGVEYTGKWISVPLRTPPDEDSAITNSDSHVLKEGMKARIPFGGGVEHRQIHVCAAM